MRKYTFIGFLLLLCVNMTSSNAKELITFINPFSPGSATELILRTIATEIEIIYPEKYEVLVESRPGAAGSIALKYVSNYDGNQTIFVAVPNILIYANKEFDLNKLIPVVYFGEISTVLIVNKNKLPNINSWKDFIKVDNSKNLMFGSSGVGSGPFLQTELLKYYNNKNWTNVPYKGSPQAMLDLHAGNIDFMIQFPKSITIQSNIIPLVIFGPNRVSEFSNTPTYKEVEIQKDWYIPTIQGLAVNKNANANIVKDVYNVIESLYSSEMGRKKIQYGTDLVVKLEYFKMNFKDFLIKEINTYNNLSKNISAFKHE